MECSIHKELLLQGYDFVIKYSNGSYGYIFKGDCSNVAFVNPNNNIINIWTKTSYIICTFDEYINKMRLDKILKIKERVGYKV